MTLHLTQLIKTKPILKHLGFVIKLNIYLWFTFIIQSGKGEMFASTKGVSVPFTSAGGNGEEHHRLLSSSGEGQSHHQHHRL